MTKYNKAYEMMARVMFVDGGRIECECEDCGKLGLGLSGLSVSWRTIARS